MTPEDVEIFFTDFAQEVEAVPQTGDPFTFLAIFDNAYFSPEVGEMVSDSTEPRIECQSIHAELLTRGDTIIIAGKSFSVLEPRPDADNATSMVTLAHG